MVEPTPINGSGGDSDIDAFFRSRGMQTYGEVQKKQEELIPKYEEAQKPVVESLEKARAERDKLIATPIKPPAPPTLQDIPKAPQQQYQDPMKAFGSPAVILATLGSLFTRHPLKVAFDSAAKAMEGFHKGDKEAAELEQKNWQEATEAAIQQNKIELEKYQQAWKETEHNVAERMARMQAIAAGVKDEVMLSGIKTGNLDLMWKTLEKREQAMDKLVQWRDQERYRQERLQIERAKLGEGQDTGAEAKAIAEGRQAPYTGVAARSYRGSEIMRQVYQLNPDYDAARDWFAKLGREKVAGAADMRSLSNSLNAMVGQKNAIEAFENTAIKNLDVLVDLAKKVDATGVPAIERWVRGGRQAAGSPDIAEFHLQWSLTVPEIAKILTNPRLVGVLSDSARHEVQEALPYASSAEQLKRIADRLKLDFKNRSTATDEQIEKIRRQIRGEKSEAEPTKTAPAPAGGADDGWTVKRVE